MGANEEVNELTNVIQGLQEKVEIMETAND